MGEGARKMSRLRLQFKKVSLELLPRLAEDIGKAALARVNAGFAQGRSPYDDAWAPTQAGNPPLRGPTGQLEGSYKMVLVPGQFGQYGFKIYTHLYYALFAQSRRPMLPVSARIGKEWAKALRDAGKASLAEITRQLKP